MVLSERENMTRRRLVFLSTESLNVLPIADFEALLAKDRMKEKTHSDSSPLKVISSR